VGKKRGWVLFWTHQPYIGKAETTCRHLDETRMDLT
jgi:hypothetical protein